MFFLSKIKNKFKNIKKKYDLVSKTSEKELLIMNKLQEIAKLSQYDEETKTLFINVPDNLVIKSGGSTLHIAEQGYIVSIANKIHLNPVLHPQSPLNINKINYGTNVINNFEKASFNILKKDFNE